MTGNFTRCMVFFSNLKRYSPLIRFTHLGDLRITLIAVNCEMNLPGRNNWSANSTLFKNRGKKKST